MTREFPTFKYESFNPELLYVSAETDATGAFDDVLEDYREIGSSRSWFREHVAIIDYDRLYDDMIYPS